MSDGRVVVDSIFDTSNVEQGLRNLQSSMQKTGDEMIKTGKNLSLKVTAPIVGAFGVAVKGAADLEGAISKFNVVFDGMSDEMMDWVGTYRKEFPLARREIIKHSADLQDLLVPMGVNRKEAMGMTQDWLELAGALAAFNDVPIEQALGAIRSGIAGQSEPLRQFGIDASVASLEQIALAHGLMEAGEKMTTQVRQQALLIQAYEQSSDAVNGLEEQKGSLLWKMQELWATIKDTSDIFGKQLIPVVSRVTEILTDLAERFRQLDPQIQKIITVVALVAAAIGPLLIAGGIILKGLAAITAALSAVSLPMLAIVGIIAALALGITQLEIDWMSVFESIVDWIMKFVDAIKTFAEPIIEQFKNSIMIFLEAIKPAWASLMQAFEDMTPILLALGAIVGSVFATALAVITGVINGIIQGLGPLIEAFGNLLSFISNVVMGISRLFVGDLVGALDYWNKAVENMIDFFKNGMKALLGIVKGFVEGVVSFFHGLYMTLVGNSIIPDMVNGIISWFWQLPNRALDATKDMVNRVIGAVKDMPSKMANIGRDIAMGMANGIKNAASNAISAARNMASSVADSVKSTLRISSPSKVMIEMGEYTGEGFEIGLSDKVRDVANRARDIASSAIPNVAPTMAMAGGGTVNHSGTIRIEGVNDQGQFINAVEIVLEGIKNPGVQKAVSRTLYGNSEGRTRGLGGKG